jgi:hypothetical protein
MLWLQFSAIFANFRREKIGVFLSSSCQRSFIQLHSIVFLQNVVITIFCDFRQFSAEKWRFFLKNQRYDPNFAKTSRHFAQKNAKLSPFFLQNYSKIITAANATHLQKLLSVCLTNPPPQGRMREGPALTCRYLPPRKTTTIYEPPIPTRFEL